MKKVIAIISLAVSILCSGMSVYAAPGNSAEADKKIQVEKPDPALIQEARDNLINKINASKNTLKLAEKDELSLIRDAVLKSDNGLIKYINENQYKLEYDKAYKVFSFTGNKIVTQYKMSKNVDKLIANDQYVWKIPLSKNDVSEKVLNVKTTNSSIDFIAIENNISLLTKQLISKPDFTKSLLQNLKTESISDLKVISSHYYKTQFVYFTSAGVDFLVPYVKGNFKNGLESGKVYQANQVFEKLNLIFDESKSPEPASGIIIGGDEPVRRAAVDYSFYMYLFGALGLIGLTSLFLLRKHFNKVKAVYEHI